MLKRHAMQTIYNFWHFTVAIISSWRSNGAAVIVFIFFSFPNAIIWGAELRKRIDSALPVERRQKLVLALSVLYLFFACFMAWNDEYLKANPPADVPSDEEVKVLNKLYDALAKDGDAVLLKARSTMTSQDDSTLLGVTEAIGKLRDDLYSIKMNNPRYADTVDIIAPLSPQIYGDMVSTITFFREFVAIADKNSSVTKTVINHEIAETNDKADNFARWYRNAAKTALEKASFK